MSDPADKVESAKQLMAALLRQKPKLHEDMKIGRKKPAKASSSKRASDKPKTS
jgi:hypothetical protein